MAGLVTYIGALRPADVTTSDGKHYLVNPGDTISVPNADAVAMMANSDWAAADGGTATLQPTPAPVVEEAWIVDGVLSKPSPTAPKGWSAVSAGSSVTPTAVKTGAYTAAAGEVVRADASGTQRTLYDLSMTNASAVVTSATAAFTSADVGLPIYANSLPIGATILSVQSATQATVSGNATATATGVVVTIGTGVQTITLPSGASPGAVVTVKKMDATSRQVQVVPAGSDTIDGQTVVALRVQYMSRTFRKDTATTWVVEAGLTPLGAQVPARGGSVVNWIGDSIAPTRQAVSGIGAGLAGVAFGPADFLAWAHWLSNGKILYGKAGGVGSERADQMAARVDPDSLAFGGQFCGVNTGTNDASLGRTAAQYAADIRALTSAIVARGQVPVLTSGTPQPNTGAPNYRLQHDRFRRFNQALAAANGWPWVDWYSKLVDPATGGYLAAYDSGDGIHPNNAGKQLMGQTLVDALSPFLAPFATVLPQLGDNTQTANLLLNGTMAGAGSAPTSWTKTGAVPSSLVTDAAVVGQAMRLNDTASSGFTQITQQVPSPTSLQGHKLAFTGKFKAVGTVAFNVLLTSNGTSPVNVRPVNGIAQATPGWQTFYSEVLVPADATTLTVFFSTNGGAAVDGYFAQAGLYDLTAAGL